MFTEIEVPPDYQVWSDQSYIKVQKHLRKKKIMISEDLTLDWIAAPYFSLWKGKAGEEVIWVLHNDLASDCFIDEDITQTRQSLAFFAMRWIKSMELGVIDQVSADTAISRENLAANLQSMGKILLDTVEDPSHWE